MQSTSAVLLVSLALGCLGITVVATAQEAEVAPPAAKQDPLPGESKRVELEGRSVHYRRAGAGEVTLVFVHGWCCDAGFWKAQFHSLKDDARLIAVDLPGHGKSDPPPRDEYHADQFVEAIEAVLDEEEVEAAVMVGHSNGAPVVLHFARLRPERTLAIVSVDGSLVSVFKDEQQLRTLSQPFVAPTYRIALAGQVNGMLPASMDKELKEFIRGRMLGARKEAVAGNLIACNHPHIFEGEPLEVPVLHVMAESPVWNAEFRQATEVVAPESTWHTVKGASHFLMMERPGEFRTVLMEFLERQELLAGD